MLPFPETTEFNKRIPKQKFYDHLDISPAIKKMFVEQIQSIIWRNKLAPATINLVTGQAVTEIEVFRITLNSASLDEAVLKQIDRQIPYHILFLLSYDGQVQAAIGHKKGTSSGTNPFKVNRYFYTPWVKEEDLSLTIRGADLDAVWENFIVQIGGITIQQGNTLDEQIAADEQREKLEKEIARLEKLAWAEKQPKKKYELVQQIQNLKQIGD